MVVHFSLGSNRGDRQAIINNACKLISSEIGEISKKSATIETEPWGYSDEQNYLNIAIELSTNMSLYDILLCTQEIEKKLGRDTKTTLNKDGSPCYSGRTIDIDILLAENKIVNTTQLIIPHKEMHKRLFVLGPLAEIAAEAEHPILGQTVLNLFDELKEKE